MACLLGLGAMSSLLFMENEALERSRTLLATSVTSNWINEPSFSGQRSGISFLAKCTAFSMKR